MKVMEITKNALKYPFSDWKKLLILGVILVVTDIVHISMNFGENVDLLVLLIGIAFIIGFLVNGYIFRIINSSFDSKIELPEFNNWVNMGEEGAKVYMVYMVYLIPIILLIIYLILSYYGAILNFNHYFRLNVFDYLDPVYNSVLWQGINSFLGLISLFVIDTGHGYAFIGMLYIIIITPILLIAIANMVYDGGYLKSAFKIREIIGEISAIGWKNLIKWYILTGIIFIILMILSTFIFYFFNFINHLLGEIINALIIYPYITIFLARSVALFYMPDEEDS